MIRKCERKTLVAAFTAVIFGVGLTQAALELRQAKSPGIADLFTQMPTKDALRAFEKDLEDHSWFSQAMRPRMQYLHYTVLKDAGEEALSGRDGWLFYRPGVRYLTQTLPSNKASGDPVSAIVAFRDRLSSRGIRLLVVPVPGKASVYPDMLTSRALHLDRPVNRHTLAVIEALRKAGVETVDLTETFSKARSASSPKTDEPYYLAQDTHWAPQGMRLAAKTVAERLLALGWVEKGPPRYALQPAPVDRLGDVLKMMQSPQIERHSTPEQVRSIQVVDPRTDAPYKDDTASEVLVLGDSFLRIYESDPPGSGGFIAHLAYELQLPLASIVNDGGASTLVRQELSRKPALLENKRVVIWEFVERDIRFGTEGWQDVPLP